MSISQQGALNTTALIVPDIYVQIVPPQNILLNGVPTNVVGVVGTAQWGPVNVPTIIASMSDYARAFGAIQNRANDMGTDVAVAVQQGANNFRCVRVTDGTDVAASGTVGGTGALAITARYTGTLGNSISVTVANGSAANSWKFSVGIPGQVPEIFDNIAGSGNALWLNAATAINAGSSILRGMSQFVTASAGASTSAPIAGTVTLAGGTDGASVNSSALMGSDAARTGVYSLRGTGISVLNVAGLTDTTQWSGLSALALSEGFYSILALPAGTTVAGAISTKATAGIDSYGTKVLHGDWLYWQDNVNGVLRLVSPVAVISGLMVNLSPERSTLNKRLYGIVGSQRSGLPSSGAANTYSSAELQALFAAGIDLICNPVPGGSYWGARLGHNSSSNAAVSGDNYTRLTNYIASTLNAGMGIYVGEVINNDTFRRISATLNSFLQALQSQGMISTLADGSSPYQVVCDASNNPQSRTALGYVQADVKVVYMGIVEKLLINLSGGTTVTITRTTTPALAA